MSDDLYLNTLRAEREGYEDWGCGVTPGQNPFSQDPLREAWRRGWLEAEVLWFSTAGYDDASLEDEEDDA